MKKVLLLSSLLALGAVASFGAQITECSAPGGNATISTLVGINANTYLCGDKLFSNFQITGGNDGSVFMREITTNNFELNFTGAGSGISSVFTFSFDVSVTTPLLFQISQVQDGMLTNVAGGGASSIPNASTAVVTQVGGPISLNALSAPGENGLANGNTTSETISFAFNPNGNPTNGACPGGVCSAGNFLSVDYVISQSTVPEPMTFSLMGAGLLGLGLLRKRISRS